MTQYKLNKNVELTQEDAKRFAESNPYRFFAWKGFVEKFPYLEETAAKNLAKTNHYLFIFNFNLHKKYPQFLLLVGKKKPEKK